MQKETPWLAAMYSIATKYSNSDKYNLSGLFMDIEKCAQEYRLSNNEVFNVPLENGAFLKHIFKEKGTDVVYCSPAGKEIVLLDKDTETSPGKMYEALNVFVDKQAGVGDKYPERFKDTVRNIREGDIIVTGNKYSYVCIENNFDEIKFAQYGNASYDFSNNTNTIIVNHRDDASMQFFFNEISGKELGKQNYKHILSEKAHGFNRGMKA